MKQVVCNLCGADEWKVRFPNTMPELVSESELDVRAFRCTSAGYGRHAQIVTCLRCGYVYANPTWDEAELLRLYGAVEDETYVTEQHGRRLTFRKHLRAFERVAGAGHGRSLLDVGAYTGIFVEAAREAGWDAWGVEPSDWAVLEAQRCGLPMIHGTQFAAELQGRAFDALTMWDVIEHVTDPSAELAQANRLLKPGGYIAVHTMNIDSFVARLMGGRWPWLMAMHIHYFSQRTLAEMLRKNGFEVIWSGAQGRYVRLNYLASRLGGLNKAVGRLADWLIKRMGIEARAVPINLGDLFTVYGRKQSELQE